ncbi:MAG: STAS domain-containing protein [Gammaproteobacteria bacterium]|nr:STAS domain-containing protein [Gammaproteobacteria bacterium]
MNQDNGLTVHEGTIKVHGQLTFATVPGLFMESNSIIKSVSETIIIDLQDVSRTDSAGLALLVEWLRVGGAHARFVNVPAQLRRLIDVSGLARAFGID